MLAAPFTAYAIVMAEADAVVSFVELPSDRRSIRVHVEPKENVQVPRVASINTTRSPFCTPAGQPGMAAPAVEL
jgi:hypothetical protein